MAVDIQISLLMMLVLARCLNPIRQNVLVLAMFLARMFKHAVAIPRPKDEGSHSKCQKLFEGLFQKFLFSTNVS